MPGIIPLIYKKGKTSSLGAFVLLDGILIITHDKNFLKAWHARLRRNEEVANVERKVTHTVRLTDTTRICTTCSETTAKCTTFAGVELCTAGRCEPASEETPALPLTPTWREVAGALGSMLWQIRVKTAGIPARLSQRSLLHAESILQVWTEVGRRAPLEGWDTVASGLDRESLGADLDRAGGLHSEPEKILGPCCQRCLKNTRYVVTDAMPQSIGWVIFTRNARGDLIPTRAGHAEVLETVQSQSEMLAAQRGIVEALEGSTEVCSLCGWPPIVILAVDADGVRFCINKGYSGNENFRMALRAMPLAAVSTVRVPGKDNVADKPSRRGGTDVGELDREAAEASALRLEIGFQELLRSNALYGLGGSSVA
jgi:hypothetical protein